MTRCPQCRAANPDEASACWQCKAALLQAELEPWFTREAWWNLRVLQRAALGALFVWLVRLPLTPWLQLLGGSRDEQSVLLFHILLGLSLGFALRWVRGWHENGGWMWVLAGLLGSLLSFTFDFLYTYQYFIYKGVWYVLLWIFQPTASENTRWTFGVLQVLRFLGPVLLITAFWARLRPSFAEWLRVIVLMGLAFWLRATVLGIHMGAWRGATSLFHNAAYFGSVALVLYAWALGPKEKGLILKPIEGLKASKRRLTQKP